MISFLPFLKEIYQHDYGLETDNQSHEWVDRLPSEALQLNLKSLKAFRITEADTDIRLFDPAALLIAS